LGFNVTIFPGNVRPQTQLSLKDELNLIRDSFNRGGNNGETVSTIFPPLYSFVLMSSFSAFAAGQIEIMTIIN